MAVPVVETTAMTKEKDNTNKIRVYVIDTAGNSLISWICLREIIEVLCFFRQLYFVKRKLLKLAQELEIKDALYGWIYTMEIWTDSSYHNLEMEWFIANWTRHYLNAMLWWFKCACLGLKTILTLWNHSPIVWLFLCHLIIAALLYQQFDHCL